MSHGNESFNYLDYVGTQTLAMDIDRLRQALGAEKLSFMGLSYGTAVSVVYATAYPEHVGKVVLNGVVTPGPMKEDYYSSQVISSQQAMAKYLQICNDEGEKQHVPDDMLTRCALPTTDPELFFADLVEKIRRNASSPSSMYSRSTRTGKAFTLTPPMLYQYMNTDITLPSASPWTKTLELLNMLGGHNESAVTSATESILIKCARTTGRPMDTASTTWTMSTAHTRMAGSPRMRSVAWTMQASTLPRVARAFSTP